MKTKLEISIAFITDLIINGVPYYILKQKQIDMAGIFIITGIIIFGVAIAFIILYDKLQRFSKQNFDIINSFMQMNKQILGQEHNQNIVLTYLEFINKADTYGYIDYEAFLDIFIFDKKNPFRKKYIKALKNKQEHEHNRDNEQVSDRT